MTEAKRLLFKKIDIHQGTSCCLPWFGRSPIEHDLKLCQEMKKQLGDLAILEALEMWLNSVRLLQEELDRSYKIIAALRERYESI